jgi:hypothetical protein
VVLTLPIALLARTVRMPPFLVNIMLMVDRKSIRAMVEPMPHTALILVNIVRTNPAGPVKMMRRVDKRRSLRLVVVQIVPTIRFKSNISLVIIVLRPNPMYLNMALVVDLRPTPV